MKVIQIVTSGGERLAPVVFPGLKEFYLELLNFLQAPDDDSSPSKWDQMKGDFVLVLSESRPDSDEAQFSLLPMITIEHLFELFKNGADEPSRPYSGV